MLGRHVDRKYYADAERFGRNHLIETQYLSLDQLNYAVAKLTEDTEPAPNDGKYSTTERVAASQIGAFASRSTLNDAFHTDAPAMMQCCNAAGARAIYDLWRYATDDGAIHICFSVETESLRVVSHEPSRGQLDITPRRDGPLQVRLPEGVCVAVVTGQSGARDLRAMHGYVTFDANAGRSFTLRYELPERKAHYTVGTPGKTESCAGHWRCETLVSVEPAGGLYPLYQRPLDAPPAEPELPPAPPIAALL